MTVGLDPLRNLLQRGRIQSAWPRLGRTAARNKTRALQHLQMLGDRGLGHVERRSQLGDCCLTCRKPRQDGPPCRVSEGRKRRIESISCHDISIWLYYQLAI